MSTTDSLLALIPVFKEYVENRRDFKALEKLPTLYHKVEVYSVPMYDAIAIEIMTRAFQKEGASTRGGALTLLSGLWGVEATHRRPDNVKQTKRQIAEKLKVLRKTVEDQSYPVSRKTVLEVREARKKGVNASSVAIPLELS